MLVSEGNSLLDREDRSFIVWRECHTLLDSEGHSLLDSKGHSLLDSEGRPLFGIEDHPLLGEGKPFLDS